MKLHTIYLSMGGVPRSCNGTTHWYYTDRATAVLGAHEPRPYKPYALKGLFIPLITYDYLIVGQDPARFPIIRVYE